MRALSIISLIFGILIMLGSFVAMAAAYSAYRNDVYSDFGEFGGYIRHFSPGPYIGGIGFGFLLTLLGIIGIIATRKKPAPVVNVYQNTPVQPQYNQPPVNNTVHQNSQAAAPPVFNQQNTPPVSTAQKAPALSSDVLDQLERLGKMKDAGILTDEEFSEQKKKLLS